MRITAAAQRLGISPRMLRYREFLGLLPVVRNPRRSRSAGPGSAGPAAAAGPAVPADAGSPRHRRFEAADLDAVALGLSIERRYDISPAALAFGVQVLADPRVRADVADLRPRLREGAGPAAAEPVRPGSAFSARPAAAALASIGWVEHHCRCFRSEVPPALMRQPPTSGCALRYSVTAARGPGAAPGCRRRQCTDGGSLPACGCAHATAGGGGAGPAERVASTTAAPRAPPARQST